MLNDEMLLSIIIPAYNIEKYIAKCLDSIMAQTYHPLEVIVVDDGSIDATPAILDEYALKYERIHVIHKENGGVTSARLCGLEYARGEWISFVDGDDWLEQDMFEHLIMNALKYHTEISHCGYQMVFPDRIDYYYNTGKIMYQETREALKELLAGSFEPGLWNKIYRRSLISGLLQKVSIDTGIRINEDLLMNYYLFREAKTLIYEDFCPYHYQIRKGSAATSSAQLNKMKDPVKVWNIISKDTKDDPELHSICISNLAEKLIRFSTIPAKNKEDEIKTCILESRAQLKKLIPVILRDPQISLRIRLLAGFAVSMPALYHRVHKLYQTLTGSRKKYDIK